MRAHPVMGMANYTHVVYRSVERERACKRDGLEEGNARFYEFGLSSDWPNLLIKIHSDFSPRLSPPTALYFFLEEGKNNNRFG